MLITFVLESIQYFTIVGKYTHSYFNTKVSIFHVPLHPGNVSNLIYDHFLAKKVRPDLSAAVYTLGEESKKAVLYD